MTLARAISPAVADQARRRVLPSGLFGMVALIVAAECFLAPRIRTIEPVSRVEMSWNSSVRAAERPEVRPEVLCLGDSLIKLGILPRVLEDRLGFPAYNLAVLGGQAPSSDFLLRRVLEKGIRPRALLVDFSPDLLALAPGLNPTCWAHTMGCRQSFEVAWHSCDPALAISTGLHWLLPGWCDQNHRQPLRGFDALGGGADDRHVFERNWRVNRGAQVAPRAFVPVEGLSSANGQRWRPHAANAFYVDRLLRTAEAAKIQVFWILTPEISGHREQLEQNGVLAAYRQFIALRLAGFSCLSVLDGQRLFGNKDAFRDPIHVNRDGAIGLSLAVAEATKPRLSGETRIPRWIDLVEITDQETGMYQNLIEDLDQSRAAAFSSGARQSFRKVALW